MFGFLKGLFGSSEKTGGIIEKAADGIYNGIDKLVYTEEEKAEALADGRRLFMKFAESAYDQNSIRAVTRRWLSFMVVGPTMLCVILSVVFHGIGTFGMELQDGTNAAINYAGFLFSMVTTLAPWTAGVLAFYFGPHLIGAFKGTYQQK